MFKQENYQAEIFSPQQSRILELSDNMTNNYSVYLLRANYEQPIEERIEFRGQRYIKNYYQNNQLLKLMAIKEQKVGTQVKFSAAVFNKQYLTGQYIQDVNILGNWLAIDNCDNFFSYHLQHRLLFLVSKLNETSPIQSLRKQRNKLSKANNGESTTKYNALNTFLDALDKGDHQTFFDILSRSSNSIYKALIKPRLNIYKICCLTFDFTATSARYTTTFQTLTDLIGLDEYKRFQQEYNRQNYLQANQYSQY